MARERARLKWGWWVVGAAVVVWAGVLIWFGYQKSRGPTSARAAALPRAAQERWERARRADPRYDQAQRVLIERAGGNVNIVIEGKPAEACMTGGAPGSSCGEPTKRFQFENIGKGLIAVYYRPDNGCYYVMGKVRVRPTGESVEYGVIDKDGHSLGPQQWWKNVGPDVAAAQAQQEKWERALKADPRHHQVLEMLMQRHGSNIDIKVEGKPATALTASMPPGGSCGTSGRLHFENVGNGLVSVYHRPDNGCYYVMGKVRVHPTGDVVEYGVIDKDGHSLGSKEWWR